MPADVSRETSVPPPPVARIICGDAFEAMQEYAAMLSGAGAQRGLIGPREVPRLWHRHLLNCAVVAAAVPASAQVIDVGSGAGLPGLTWALLRRDLELVLLEPSLRRTDFLHEVVAALDLTQVRIDRRRAEEAAGDLSADVVTARAVAPLERLLGWTLPLLRPGGLLLALKGRTAADELRAAAGTLSTAGAPDARLRTYGEDVLDLPTTVVEIRTPLTA